MRINVTSVFVDDQDKALGFYTDVLGFVKKTEIPLGEDRWLMWSHPRIPTAPNCCWNPMVTLPSGRSRRRWSRMDPRRLVRRRRRRAEHERLAALGVRFTQDPTEMGPVTTAVLDDTCGNLIQIASLSLS